MPGKTFLEIFTSRLCSYPLGQKSCQTRSISLHFWNKRDFAFNAEIQDGRQKWQENNFCEKSPVDSTHTLQLKNFVEIALSLSIIEINTFLLLTQKFKIAAKSGRKNDFCEKSPVGFKDTLWVKHFVEIALSHSVSEINTFLHFTQKFKMAAKSGGKTFFEKSHH